MYLACLPLALTLLVASAACGRFGFDAQGAGPDADDSVDAALIDGPLGERPPEFTSGTRLRAATYRAGDLVLFHQWFDTQFNVACSVTRAADGQLRCLPFSLDNRVFADAACTQPLILVSPNYGNEATCPMSTMGAVVTEAGTEMYAAGAAHSGPTYGINGSVCEPASYSTTIDFYLRGPAIALNQFVAFTEERIPQGRLAYINWRGDDGSQQLSSDFYDTELEAACSFTELSAGVGHCLGGDFAAGRLAFADPACTTPVLLHAPADAARTLQTFDLALCGYAIEYHTVGAPHFGDVYQWVDGVCTYEPGLPSDVTSQIASSRSLDEMFVTAVPQATGSQRLQRYEWVTAQGVRATQVDRGPVAYDAVLERRCTPAPIGSAGDEGCAPVWSVHPTVSLYASTDCTGAPVQGLPTCHFAQSVLWFVAIPNTPRCSGYGVDPRAFDVAATTPMSYWDRGTCVMLDPNEVYTGFRTLPFTIDDVVPLARELEVP